MWRNRNVWILMSGEMIAGLGMWFGLIGNLDFLQHTVPSDFLKAVILMAGAFVGVLLGPLAGRVVDQSEKKKILILAGMVRIIGVLFMFLALHEGSVWWMLGYTILIGGAAAFYFPALQSVIPLIVREEQLMSVNGVYMNITTLSRVIGTAAAGVLLLVMSLFSIYLYSLIAYVLLLGFTFNLQINEQKRDNAEGKARKVKQKAGFKEVLPIIKAAPTVLMTLMLTLAPTLFIGSFNLMVITISDLQADASIKGTLYTTEGVSLMLGAFLTKRLAVGRNMVPLLIGSALLVGIGQLSLYFAAIPIVSIAGFGLFGLAAGCFYTLTSTLFQKQVPQEFHGRFFSFRGMLDRVSFQVVMLGAGLFLDTLGFQTMVVSFGLLSLLVSGYFTWQQVRRPLSFVDGTRSVEKAG
ncbi:MAG: MFS transporter [Tumebacillaceae bacterium]